MTAQVKSSPYGEPLRGTHAHLWPEATWRRKVLAALLEVSSLNMRGRLAQLVSFHFPKSQLRIQ